MDGKPVKNYSPIGSIERGVALCPEDRKDEGIVAELTVRENIILAMQASLGWFKHLSLQKQYEIADKYIKLLNISYPLSRSAGQESERRQPAKGDPGSLACHEPTASDPG